MTNDSITIRSMIRKCEHMQKKIHLNKFSKNLNTFEFYYLFTTIGLLYFSNL